MFADWSHVYLSKASLSCLQILKDLSIPKTLSEQRGARTEEARARVHKCVRSTSFVEYPLPRLLESCVGGTKRWGTESSRHKLGKETVQQSLRWTSSFYFTHSRTVSGGSQSFPLFQYSKHSKTHDTPLCNQKRVLHTLRLFISGLKKKKPSALVSSMMCSKQACSGCN